MLRRSQVSPATCSAILQWIDEAEDQDPPGLSWKELKEKTVSLKTAKGKGLSETNLAWALKFSKAKGLIYKIGHRYRSRSRKLTKGVILSAQIQKFLTQNEDKEVGKGEIVKDEALFFKTDFFLETGLLKEIYEDEAIWNTARELDSLLREKIHAFYRVRTPSKPDVKVKRDLFAKLKYLRNGASEEELRRIDALDEYFRSKEGMKKIAMQEALGTHHAIFFVPVQGFMAETNRAVAIHWRG